MAQTGDVQFGNSNSESFDLRRAGTGGSGNNITAEVNDTPHIEGQYTVWGEVIEGMEFVDKIKRGDPIKNGMVDDPDKIIKMWIE